MDIALSIKKFISVMFFLYTLVLLIRVLGSWVPQLQDHPLMRFIKKISDPYLNLFRRFIPPLGMMDLSPLVAFISLQVIEWFVLSLL